MEKLNLRNAEANKNLGEIVGSNKEPSTDEVLQAWNKINPGYNFSNKDVYLEFNESYNGWYLNSYEKSEKNYGSLEILFNYKQQTL
ncbi:hypothetical protein [Spiroplasma turonicum]|uniref:hypothetical protein n=1 Tax=Spiroplasma turonicum TaxID=216946 RepID=UPI00094628FC|nr:hypothetical protein [Spiroplasma turonicum]